MNEDKVPCPHCGKWLKGNAGVRSHIKMKHGGKGIGRYREEREESFADRAIEAEIARACGLPTDDDWLLPCS